MQSRLWGVMTVTPMNNASLPPAPLPNPPLISGRPIARRVPGPSQPSFPHGKYLTLTVAHVCHITCRFRREKKTLYVWWMMELYNRILMKRSFILLWCINCLEHIHLHTPCYHTSSNTCTTPRYWTHIHTFPPPTPPPHPKPGMCKHGPHLASTTFLCYSSPPPPKKGESKDGCLRVYSMFLRKKQKMRELNYFDLILSLVWHYLAALWEPRLWRETTGSGLDERQAGCVIKLQLLPWIKDSNSPPPPRYGSWF